MKCFDIFSSNRIFLSRGKRSRGVQPAQICLCLIKGCNFLFISGPLPPTPSSRLLIPPLQNAPTVPPIPGPSCWCPACLRFSLLRSGLGSGEAIRFVSAGLWQSVNKSSLSRAGVVTEEVDGRGGGGIAVWFLFKATYTHMCVCISHTRACEGTEGFTQLQAWDQSPSRAQVALTQPLPS